MANLKQYFNAAVLMVTAQMVIGSIFYASAVKAEDTQKKQVPNGNAYAYGQQKKSDNSTTASNEKNKDKKQYDACTAVRANIANRTANLQERAQRHMEVIDKVYANLSEFATKNNTSISEQQKLNVANARQAAANAISEVGPQEDALNCEDGNVGSSAAKLRLSVQKLTDTTIAYRSAVGDAIAEMRALVNASSTDTTKEAR